MSAASAALDASNDFHTVFKDSGGPKAYTTALARYVKAAELPTAAPLQRVTAAYRALVLVGRSDIQDSSKLALLVTRLMPTLSPRLLKRQEQASIISMFSGLGSYFAVLLLEAGHDIVEAANALETRHGILNSLLIDTRTYLTALEERDEALAAQFADLCSIAGRGGQALLVSMKETPGENSLPFAEEEADLARPPTKSSVLADLSTAAIVLLSCHGVADHDEPSLSRLLLSDWQSEPLIVADITAQRLPCAHTAYLSACHAAVGRAADLLDEGIHLAAAFHLAGFPRVVGTLWQVNDRRAMQVSRRVWELLMGDGRLRYELLGEALNTALGS